MQHFNSTAFREFLNNGWMLTLDANQILVGWGELKDTAPTTTSFVAPDFYLGPTPSQPGAQQKWASWRHTECSEILSRDQFASLVLASVYKNVNANLDDKPKQFQWLEPDFEEFREAWQEIQSGFRSRGLIKAVPVVFAKSQGAVDSARRLRLLKSLALLPRQLYVYGFWDSHGGMMGASPEILFSQTGDLAIETVALAGTRAKSESGNCVHALMSDAKERFEHQLVIDDLKARLSQIGDVAIGETGVLELPMLYHLKTRVQSRPRETPDFVRLIELLHPTPALGVAPRDLGFNEMRLWDNPALRGRYGAPFGAIYHDRAGQKRCHCLVAIRNIQWAGEDVRLGSGCGVVSESTLEREWTELKLKRDSVKRMLDL